MSTDRPPPPTKPATIATGNVNRESSSPSAAIRQRLHHRQSSPNESRSPKPALARRRSSVLSYAGIEEVTNVLTNDIINPSMTRPKTSRDHEEVTHWHSTPLAFAILPAIGGLLFKNGSAFITDVLLLTLAAIFMNWSIRLPWDWYYSAQAQRRDVGPGLGDMLDDEMDEKAMESASSAGGSPKPAAQLDTVPEAEIPPPQLLKREEAATELRRLELLALLATFVFPMLTAYLLHVIRGQLSPSSTGLVSDYNLTIFLLAAEIRPARQLIRLITTRTLHLQRTVTGLNDPLGSAVEEKNAVVELKSRIAGLETKFADHALIPQDISLAQKQDISELSVEMRKRYEPRLEGLERAVRRYEKKSTTLSMLTDQRIASLEARLQDALSLAAVAAQQSQTKGAFAKLLDNLAMVILWPLKILYRIAMSPLRMLEEMYGKIKRILFGTATSPSVKRNSSRSGGSKDERLKEKVIVRKPVR